MALKEMSKQNQLMLLIVIGIMVAGVYVKLRYLPAASVVAKAGKTLDKNINKIENPKFPEEPEESAEELQLELDELEARLEGLVVQASHAKESLAPTDNQDVFIKLSEAARAAGVKITENVPYLVQRRIQDNTAAKTKNMTPMQLRQLKKAQRKKAKARGRVLIGALTKQGSLIDRVTNDLAEARPLHKISVEGPFYHFQDFLQAVKALPWQVTIVKMEVGVNVTASRQLPAGAVKPINVNMIVAI